MSKQESKVDNPVLFLLISVLLILTFAFIFYQLLNFKKPGGNKTEISEEPIITNIPEEQGSLSDYFANRSDSGTSGKSDYYLQNDPFREVCSQKTNGKKPVIVSGTVCYR